MERHHHLRRVVRKKLISGSAGFGCFDNVVNGDDGVNGMPLPQIVDIIGIAAQPLDFDGTSLTVKPSAEWWQAGRANWMVCGIHRRDEELPHVVRNLRGNRMVNVAGLAPTPMRFTTAVLQVNGLRIPPAIIPSNQQRFPSEFI